MLKYQVWLFIAIALLTFDFPPVTCITCQDDYFEAIGLCFRKDWRCPDGSIFFNGQCYFISNNYCSTSELWISDKCCTIDCLASCPEGYCSHCCNKLAYSVPPAVTQSPIPPNTGCPNEPVTPYPILPVSPLPPVIGCPNEPVTPYPVTPVKPNVPPTGCPNEPVTPYPVIPVNPHPPAIGCPNEPVTPYPVVTPNPMPPVIPCASHPGVNNCHQPCCQPCCSSNCCGCTNNCNQQPFQPSCCQNNCSTNCCNTSHPPVTPQPPTTSPTNPPFPILPPTTSIPPIITTKPPPPANITRCPPGTIRIGLSCHLIYCPSGSVMRDNRCVFIECPEGTVWTGYRCSMPEPTTQNLTFHNTVITNFNNSKPDIILNSTNNIVVNAPITLQEESFDNDCYSDDENECEPVPTPSPPPPQTTTSKPTKCCEVMTPRICEKRNNRWHCYSRRYHRCGDFCITPIIYLRPPRTQVRPQCVVMPPLQYDCQLHGNCGQFTEGFDCSGCGMGLMESCSYYCYRYICPSQKCGFYDQEEYCSNYAGSYGCLEEDGCFDDWCQ